MLREITGDPGSGAFIKNVPFFPQTDYMCGPAALASLVSYWDDGSFKEEAGETQAIAGEIYSAKLKGTLPMDMLIYAKKKGFDVVYYRGGMDDLREKVRDGYPLILFLNLGFRSYPVGHYIVVVGYSDAAKSVVVHSGTRQEDTWTYSELEKAWSKTDYSTLFLRPKAAPDAP
ncbi:MAG: C39 family peptidase [Deltaproteobacteria bacterium]|nr:C39 family peptidase [Deltaproteobacteria bacterium]